jgi:hypothetical protein
MDVRDEINKYSSKKDRDMLLWLLGRYSLASQWRFVAKCTHKRYGRMSYQTNRVWTPTEEGKALYYYFTKTNR